MARIKLPTLLLLTAVIIGVALRVGLAASKQTITHDEMISYLGATANLGAYHDVIDGAAPNRTWATAADWKQFITPTAPFHFSQISWDQADNDIHPPLYFWLLHLWMLLVGVQPWTGASLNIFFFVAGLFALHGLARAALGSELEAAAVTLIWAVSPAVLMMSSQARHYELFGLSAILFVWLLSRYTDPARQPDWRAWLMLTLVTAVGTLTHYHFALVAAGAVIFYLAQWLRLKPRRFLSGTAAILAGYGLMFLLHPSILLSFEELAGRQAAEARYLSTGIDIMRRLYAIGDTFTRFWIYGRIPQVILFIFAVASLIWATFFYLKNRTRWQKRLQPVNGRGKELLWIFLWLFGWTIGLYLTFISPIHAMMPRHMGAIWPFYALLPVFLARLWPRQQKRILLTIGSIVLLSGILFTIQTIRANQQMPDNTAVLAGASSILIDTVERGIAPRLYWPIPDETAVFIAPQAELPALQSHWLDQLSDGAIYINDLEYDNDENGRDQILAILAQRFEPVPVPGGVWELGHIYLLREK
jgi:uncharacterized membrane protein